MIPTRRRTRRARTALLGSGALWLALAIHSRPAHAQAADSTRAAARVTGALTLTTKGISTIPSFTLGKPAAILDLAVRRGGLGFEPQFRYGLDGKPWSFLFWGRWRPIQGERLRLSVGAHPAVSFRTVPDTTGGADGERIEARRYLAGEVSPTVALSRNVSVGPYYLYSYGVERYVARHTHFVALRAQLTGPALGRYQARLAPQLYYLRVGDREGYYANASATLARQDLPVTLSTLVNRPIRTRVSGGDGLLWNVSASYAFR